jgi:hypothetical protein
MLRCYLYEAANVVAVQGLGYLACEAKRAAQSQRCRSPKQRVQVVIKGGCQSACIAGANVPAGTLALVRSLLVLRCSREQNALHTLIYQRPSHAILQRHAPYCGENPGPGTTKTRTCWPFRNLSQSAKFASLACVMKALQFQGERTGPSSQVSRRETLKVLWTDNQRSRPNSVGRGRVRSCRACRILFEI